MIKIGKKKRKAKILFVYLKYNDGELTDFQKVKRSKKVYEFLTEKDGFITVCFLVKFDNIYREQTSDSFEVHKLDLVKVKTPFIIRNVWRKEKWNKE